MEISDIIKNYFEGKGWIEEPKNLYEPIDYAMQSGGKRLRPTLVLMAVKLFGGDVERYVETAAAMEVFHNFTLLHDDVMDKADVRRGRPTIHKKWDDNTAILSGDAMLIKAYQMVASKVEDTKLRSVLDLFSKTAIEVCEGQQYDGDFEKRKDVTPDEYFNMIRLKTGVLLAASLKMGALLAGASEEEQRNIYDFGMNVGIAFQIWDDYLDCYGDEKTFGKKIGGDILCGKKTFLLVQSLIKGGASQKQTIRQLINNNNILPEEKISAIISIYTQLDMPKLCEEAMDEYFRKAMKSLSLIAKSDEEKAPFIAFAKKLMGRKS
ncbi:MAG: polyprenyl synthetase family protein [bacterium]|nr:polyprenyl synthetase family protein [Candidatus Minthenecus merdequi]